jgi:hypothetical protein
MYIRNLTPWAGARFDYDIGAIIKVSEEVGRARVAAGVAAEARESDVEPDSVFLHESAPLEQPKPGPKAGNLKGGR